MPVRIRINQDVSPTRREVALIHELIHYAEELFKWNMDHIDLHRLAVLIKSRMLTRLLAANPSDPGLFDWVLSGLHDITRILGLSAGDQELRTLASFMIDEIAPTVRAYRSRTTNG